jgi:uncharacterized protein YndB with AHSA1/START domain
MSTPDSGADFVITRTFNAPRELVYDTMTQTGHLQKWWGPQGCTIDVVTHEPRPGGIFHYCMHFGPAVEMYGRFTYRALVRPERIVFTNGFADEQGNPIRYAMSPTWPIDMLNTIVLTEDAGSTTVILRSAPLNASAVEIATFKAGHAAMQQGFGGMYEVYQQYLASLQAASTPAQTMIVTNS